MGDAYNHRIQTFDADGAFSWMLPDDMDWAEKYLALTGHDPLLCPHCKKGRMELVPIEHNQPGGSAGIAIQQTHTGDRHALGPPQAQCISQTT